MLPQPPGLGRVRRPPPACKEPSEAESRERTAGCGRAKARGLGFLCCCCSSAPRPPRKASWRRRRAGALAVSPFLRHLPVSAQAYLCVLSSSHEDTKSWARGPTPSPGQLHLKIPHRGQLQRTYVQIKSLSVQADVTFVCVLGGTLFTPPQGSSGQWPTVGRCALRMPRGRRQPGLPMLAVLGGHPPMLAVPGGIPHPPRPGPFRARPSAERLKVRGKRECRPSSVPWSNDNYPIENDKDTLHIHTLFNILRIAYNTPTICYKLYYVLHTFHSVLILFPALREGGRPFESILTHGPHPPVHFHHVPKPGRAEGVCCTATPPHTSPPLEPGRLPTPLGQKWTWVSAYKPAILPESHIAPETKTTGFAQIRRVLDTGRGPSKRPDVSARDNSVLQ